MIYKLKLYNMSAVNKTLIKKMIHKQTHLQSNKLGKINYSSNILKFLGIISSWICLNNLLNNLEPIFCRRLATSGEKSVYVGVCSLYCMNVCLWQFEYLISLKVIFTI